MCFLIFLTVYVILEMWGLTTDGTFASSSDTPSDVMGKMKAAFGFRKEDIHKTVMLDLQKVRSALSLEIQRFQFSILTEEERGKRLLYLFQKDLLPGINAMILESKGNRDFVAEANKKEKYQKTLAWIFILGLNSLLLFYIYLFAVAQSSERQDAWFRTFCVWLALEVVLMSTVVVYANHFLIPSLVMQDLQKVKRRLLMTIREYKRNIDKSDTKKATFNVANYFFVSARLSALFPDLMESKVIQKFSSPWPHQSYQRTRSLSKSYSKRFSTLMRSASMIAVFFLRGFLTVPPGVQDMIMNLITIVTTGYIFTALITLYNINPILPCIPIAVLILLLHFLTKLCCRSKKSGDPDPVSAAKNVPYAGGRKTALVLQPAAFQSKTNATDGAIEESSSSPAEPPASILKTRRQSVQHGVQVLREMESHQAASAYPHSKPKQVLGVVFADVSEDEVSSDESVSMKTCNVLAVQSAAVDGADQEIETGGHLQLADLFAMEISDESDADAGANEGSGGSGAKLGLLDVFSMDISDESDAENAEGVVGHDCPEQVQTDMFAVSISDESYAVGGGEVTEKLNSLPSLGCDRDIFSSLNNVHGHGDGDANIDDHSETTSVHAPLLSMQDILSMSVSDDDVGDEKDEHEDEGTGNPRARLVSSKEIAKATIPAVWGELSDDDEQED
jgi:hypothetical protein